MELGQFGDEDAQQGRGVYHEMSCVVLGVEARQEISERGERLEVRAMLCV